MPLPEMSETYGLTPEETEQRRQEVLEEIKSCHSNLEVLSAELKTFRNESADNRKELSEALTQEMIALKRELVTLQTELVQLRESRSSTPVTPVIPEPISEPLSVENPNAPDAEGHEVPITNHAPQPEVRQKKRVRI